jgi:hypothetical protein
LQANWNLSYTTVSADRRNALGQKRNVSRFDEPFESPTAANVSTNLVATFKWNAPSNHTHQLQRAMSLSNTPSVIWSNTDPEILGTTNVLVITNTPAFQSYFRFWVPFVCP